MRLILPLINGGRIYQGEDVELQIDHLIVRSHVSLLFKEMSERFETNLCGSTLVGFLCLDIGCNGIAIAAAAAAAAYARKKTLEMERADMQMRGGRKESKKNLFLLGPTEFM